jgi:effector-binding domain-containing protein
LVSIEVKMERLKPMRAAHVLSQSSAPEEDAQRKILEYAKLNGLMYKPDARLFGRNFYPTDKPEPHGYEYYLTIEDEAKPSVEITVKSVPEGLYAVVRVKSVFEIPQGWKNLFSMVEASGYKQVGVSKEEYGWVNAGFEEHVNWQQEKPPTEWIFNLWVKLKE